MNEETNNSKGPKIIARLLVWIAIALLVFIIILLIMKSIDNAKNTKSVEKTETKIETNTAKINSVNSNKYLAEFEYD